MDIKNECEAVVSNFTDTILFYYSEYPEERENFKQAFKEAFNEMVDEIFSEDED